MVNPPELPILISVFDQAIEQILLLIKDIEAHRWDAGVTVMVNNGALDIRGIGVASNSPATAVALLYMALRSMPQVDQRQVMLALDEVMKRSETIEAEAHLWRPQNCTKIAPQPASPLE
jgi:hypothetical protein